MLKGEVESFPKTERKRGRRVAREAAVMPTPGSIVDQMARATVESGRWRFSGESGRERGKVRYLGEGEGKRGGYGMK